MASLKSRWREFRYLRAVLLALGLTAAWLALVSWSAAARRARRREQVRRAKDAYLAACALSGRERSWRKIVAAAGAVLRLDPGDSVAMAGRRQALLERFHTMSVAAMAGGREVTGANVVAAPLQPGEDGVPSPLWADSVKPLTPAESTVKLVKGKAYRLRVAYASSQGQWLRPFETDLHVNYESPSLLRANLEELDSPPPPVAVDGALYAPLTGLAEGSAAAQQQQRQLAAAAELPLEVSTARTGIRLRLIPSGTFLMGSPATEAGRGPDERQHQVTLTRPFYCGKYPVTRRQWALVMGELPAGDPTASPDAPVVGVTWDACQQFLELLAALESVAAGTYRLLTEAEWEYSCRAGTPTPFCFGGRLEARQASFDASRPYSDSLAGAAAERTTEVGRYPANAWGLHDMHGNVWEWCSGQYSAYPEGPLTDPRGAETGSLRIARGGAWTDYGHFCRSAKRCWAYPADHWPCLGFRIAMDCE